jgi:hypothetical protein
MIIAIYALIVIAAVLYVIGAFVHFVRKHEGTVWWRGSVGLLAFAMALLLLEILDALRATR